MPIGTTPIVDTHVHFWDIHRSDLYWMTPDLAEQLRPLQRSFGPQDLDPHRQAVGVDEIVIVQAARSDWDHEWWFTLSTQHDWIVGVVGWVDLTSPDVDAQLERFSRYPAFRGVRATAENEPDPDWLKRSDVLRGIAAVASRGLTLDLLVRTEHLVHVPRLAERFPELVLVVDHLAKPPIASGNLTVWQQRMEALTPYANLWCKLSGLLTEAGPHPTPEEIRPVVEFALERFGPGRLLWGSDWPVATLAANYTTTFQLYWNLTASLTESERAALFGGNALRVYRLDHSASHTSQHE